MARAWFSKLVRHARGVLRRSALEDGRGDRGGLQALTAGSSLIAVLPDTQVYSLRSPALFHAQTAFLRDHAARLDVRCVVHLGDIVGRNTHLEWQHAAQAMAALHDVVPYVLAPGNHDYGPSGDASTRDTLMNEYFAFDRSAAMPSFGGAYEPGKLDNSYHLFSIKGRDFVLLALEWGPRDEVIAWGDQVMRQHPDREGILVTHAYLNEDDQRYDHRDRARSQRHNPHHYSTPGVNDGEQLWQKLIRHHRFVITLNGHVLGRGCGYLVSRTDRGNRCHQMLSNYQMRAQGGEAYMRLLELLDDGRTVRVHTYSPLHDRMLEEPGHNFELTLDRA